MADPLRTARVIVVGAGLAGLRVVKGLRAAGFGGRIVVVEPAEALPADRPPLSKQVLTGEWEPADAVVADAEELELLGVHVRLGTAAVGLDLEHRALRVSSGAKLRYDALVLATGAAARPLAVLAGLPGCHVLRDEHDALALRAALAPGRRLVVVGAGVLGVEIASSARALGAEVALVDLADAPLVRAVGPELGRRWTGLLEAHGVELHLGTSVVAASARGGELRLVLAGGAELPADAVVAAIGAEPATDWLRGSGLRIADGVVCDAYCAAAPRVYAAGDVARWAPAGSETLRLEHWTNAAEQAAAVAENVLWELQGRPAERRPFRPVPYVWSDHFGQRLQVLGLPGAGDELTLVHDDPGAGALLAVFGRGGRATAVAAVRRPRDLARCRPLLAAEAAVSELVAVLTGAGSPA
jgi:NADPH-dependent 2,4-dienoyl-CoA reductase/sulfur reductase-like enzyme